MDKGRAIKIGIAAVILIVAAVLIFRSLSGGGETPDVPPGPEPIGSIPSVNLLPVA